MNPVKLLLNKEYFYWFLLDTSHSHMSIRLAINFKKCDFNPRNFSPKSGMIWWDLRATEVCIETQGKWCWWKRVCLGFPGQQEDWDWHFWSCKKIILANNFEKKTGRSVIGTYEKKRKKIFLESDFTTWKKLRISMRNALICGCYRWKLLKIKVRTRPCNGD